MSDNHSYKALSGPYAGHTPPASHRTGFAYSDAVIRRECPQCGSRAGFYCETPRGEKVWPPHGERLTHVRAAPRRLEPTRSGARPSVIVALFDSIGLRHR